MSPESTDYLGRAIVFEKTGNATKTHSGARAQLGNLRNSGVPIHESFVPYLSKGYEIKADLDYGPYTPVPREAAESAVATARELIGWARDMLVRGD